MNIQLACVVINPGTGVPVSIISHMKIIYRENLNFWKMLGVIHLRNKVRQQFEKIITCLIIAQFPRQNISTWDYITLVL